MLYAWDIALRVVVQETGKLSRPLTRFDLTFVVNAVNYTQLSLWFDII